MIGVRWRMAVCPAVAAFFGVAATSSRSAAEETAVEVRVISKGAKFVGTSMGGAEVTIRDAASGELLAQGVTAGSTGDTDKIMRHEQAHHASVSTEDAAVFRTTLDLDRPRRLRFEARGPLAQPQAINTAAVTQWVVPGKPIAGGDGLTLQLPGFVVDVLAPPAHQKVAVSDSPIEVRANVTMMCGCPIEPGGLWDADRFEVAGIVRRNGERVGRFPLSYAGSTSQFAGKLQLDEPGAYVVTVYAYDPSNGNTGVDRTSLVVTE